MSVADWTDHPIRFSRFVGAFHRLSDPGVAADACAGDLVRTLERERYDFLIPVNDSALELCFAAEKLLSERTTVLGVNEPESRRFARDKSFFYEACKSIGFPVPESRYAASIEDIERLLPELRYPLIARPITSKVIHRNRLNSFSAKRFLNERKLVDHLRLSIASVPYMLQTPLNGYGAGYNLLARGGTILDAYAHRRIHEAWGGGPSSYRGTLPLDAHPEFALVPELIKRSGWSGVAMLEFLISGGHAYPIEMNGRFWGSIELGVYAGCDLPGEFFQIFGEGAPAPSPRRPRGQPVYARNLVSDVSYLMSGLAQGEGPALLARWLKSLAPLLRGLEIVEDNPFKDPGFRLAEYRQTALKLLERARWSLAARHTRVATRPRGLAGVRRAAFVCLGNICRSPFAEHYARKRVPDCEFASFGLHGAEDRMSPVHALTAAREHGLDLSKHRSRRLTPRLCETYDAIFVPERRVAWKLRRQGLAPRDKVFLLQPGDIGDVQGLDLPDFREAYATIAAAIDRMAEGR